MLQCGKRYLGYDGIWCYKTGGIGDNMRFDHSKFDRGFKNTERMINFTFWLGFVIVMVILGISIFVGYRLLVLLGVL